MKRASSVAKLVVMNFVVISIPVPIYPRFRYLIDMLVDSNSESCKFSLKSSPKTRSFYLSLFQVLSCSIEHLSFIFIQIQLANKKKENALSL